MEKNGSKTGSYKFAQIFGYKGPNERVSEQDIITSLRFDNEGRYLTLGDKAGRIIVFENLNEGTKSGPQYEYLTEFQSHYREFDPLRSREVEEDIVDMCWLSRQGKYMRLLSTNTRSIKFWKIFEKNEKKVVKSAGKDLAIPKLETVDSGYSAELKIELPNKHLNPIKQLSTSFNEQFLLSSDQSQIFMWDLEEARRPYLVCDLTANPKSDSKQTISCASMHPNSDSLIVVGMSKGSLKISDMRQSSSFDSNSTCLKMGSGSKNYLIDLISNISSAQFTQNGKYIVSRDYLTVKIWDVANTKKPVNTVILHEGLKSKLSEMVENEAIFDQFQVRSSAESNAIVTGSYNNSFHLIDLEGSNTQYELSYKKMTVSKAVTKCPIPKMDYERKVRAVDFHPAKNMVAVASLNCFFTYSL